MVTRLLLSLSLLVGCSAPPLSAPIQKFFGADRPTLFVFGTLWCDVCQKERPAVEAWARAHPDTQVIYVLSGSAKADVDRFVAQQAFDLTVLKVFSDSNGRLADRHGVKRSPTLIRYERNGDEAGRWSRIGHVSRQSLIEVNDSGAELGTTYDLTVVTTPDRRPAALHALAAARQRCRALESRLSEWKPDSEISRINREAAQRTVALSPILRRLLRGALHTSAVTDGAFDVTYGSGEGTGWDKVTLGPEGVRFAHPATKIGLGAVAKGLIVDELFTTLREAGFDHVIVNLGGDLRTSGLDRTGQRRRFRIMDPFNPSRVTTSIALQDVAIATSGNYLRKSHIVDPKTGAPPAFDGSVTVITRDAAMADALATALFVMGPDAGLRLVEKTKGVHAIYMTRSGLRSSSTALGAGP